LKRKDDKQDSFGQSFVDLLTKVMTDHAHELLVILAGYEAEMKEFLQNNEGLKSRVRLIKFETFTVEELCQVATFILPTMEGGKWTFDDEALKKLPQIMEQLPEKNARMFIFKNMDIHTHLFSLSLSLSLFLIATTHT
jgi:hypothetical protein